MSILRIKDENGNLIEIPAIKGDKGDKGDKGERGEKGEKGDTGTVDLTDYVKNTDYGSQTVSGLCRGNVYMGTYVGVNGTITISAASETEIGEKTNAYKPIVPTTLDYAVKTGLTNSAEEWTDGDKEAVRILLGLEKTNLFTDSYFEDYLNTWLHDGGLNNYESSYQSAAGTYFSGTGTMYQVIDASKISGKRVTLHFDTLQIRNHMEESMGEGDGITEVKLVNVGAGTIATFNVEKKMLYTNLDLVVTMPNYSGIPSANIGIYFGCGGSESETLINGLKLLV